jgi:hypothetical protein
MLATATATALLLGALAAGASPALQAQVRPDTTRAPAQPAPPAPQGGQPTEQGVRQQMETMGPMMGQMMQAMMESMLAALARPETAERIATFTKNYFDALVAKGFTREDALRIVMAHGIPAMPGGR